MHKQTYRTKMLNKENKIINDFINGTLSPEKAKKLSNMIKDKENNKYFTKKENSNYTEQFDVDAAWKKFSNKNINTKTIKRNKKNNFMRIAASTILLVGVSIIGYFVSSNVFNNDKYSEINSKNELKEVILPDGSIVSLNKNSNIKFPEVFGNKRIVEFSGEGFFKISKNPKSPFIIKSNNSEISVLGTSFNVNAKDKKNISVTVKTGKVKFAKNKNEHVILVAGEFGEIKNNNLSKSKNLNKNFLSWKTKQFIYKNDKLKKVISDFNKVYNVNIATSSADIEDLLISTTIKNKTINMALDIICKSNNLQYSKNKNKIIISKK